MYVSTFTVTAIQLRKVVFLLKFPEHLYMMALHAKQGSNVPMGSYRSHMAEKRAHLHIVAAGMHQFAKYTIKIANFNGILPEVQQLSHLEHFICKLI